MRNKLVAWPLVVAMLVSIVFTAAGPPAKASAAGGTNLSIGKT